MKRIIGALLLLLAEATVIAAKLLKPFYDFLATNVTFLANFVDSAYVFMLDMGQKIVDFTSFGNSEIWGWSLLAFASIIVFGLYFLIFTVIAHLTHSRKKNKQLSIAKLKEEDLKKEYLENSHEEELPTTINSSITSEPNQNIRFAYSNNVETTSATGIAIPVNEDEFDWHLYVGGFPKVRFIFLMVFILIFGAFFFVRFAYDFRNDLGLTNIGFLDDTILPFLSQPMAVLDNFSSNIFGAFGPQYSQNNGFAVLIPNVNVVANSLMNGQNLYYQTILEFAVLIFIAVDVLILYWTVCGFFGGLMGKKKAVALASEARNAYISNVASGRVQGGYLTLDMVGGGMNPSGYQAPGALLGGGYPSNQPISKGDMIASSLNYENKLVASICDIDEPLEKNINSLDTIEYIDDIAIGVSDYGVAPSRNNFDDIPDVSTIREDLSSVPSTSINDIASLDPETDIHKIPALSAYKFSNDDAAYDFNEGFEADNSVLRSVVELEEKLELVDDTLYEGTIDLDAQLLLPYDYVQKISSLDINLYNYDIVTNPEGVIVDIDERLLMDSEIDNENSLESSASQINSEAISSITTTDELLSPSSSVLEKDDKSSNNQLITAVDEILEADSNDDDLTYIDDDVIVVADKNEELAVDVKETSKELTPELVAEEVISSEPKAMEHTSHNAVSLPTHRLSPSEEIYNAKLIANHGRSLTVAPLRTPVQTITETPVVVTPKVELKEVEVIKEVIKEVPTSQVAPSTSHDAIPLSIHRLSPSYELYCSRVLARQGMNLTPTPSKVVATSVTPKLEAVTPVIVEVKKPVVIEVAPVISKAPELEEVSQISVTHEEKEIVKTVISKNTHEAVALPSSRVLPSDELYNARSSSHSPLVPVTRVLNKVTFGDVAKVETTEFYSSRDVLSEIQKEQAEVQARLAYEKKKPVTLVNVIRKAEVTSDVSSKNQNEKRLAPVSGPLHKIDKSRVRPTHITPIDLTEKRKIELHKFSNKNFRPNSSFTATQAFSKGITTVSTVVRPIAINSKNVTKLDALRAKKKHGFSAEGLVIKDPKAIRSSAIAPLRPMGNRRPANIKPISIHKVADEAEKKELVTAVKK